MKIDGSERIGPVPDCNLDSGNSQNSLEIPRMGPFGPPEIPFFSHVRRGRPSAAQNPEKKPE